MNTGEGNPDLALIIYKNTVICIKMHKYTCNNLKHCI